MLVVNDKKELAKAHADHKILTVNVVKTIQRGVFAAYKSVEFAIVLSDIPLIKVLINTFFRSNLRVFIFPNK